MPRPPLRSVERLIALHEQIEDVRQPLASDPAAPIDHPNRRFAVARVDLEPDAAAARRVLRGIADEIRLNLLQACGIADDVHRLIRHVDRQVGLALDEKRPQRLDRGARRIAKIEQRIAQDDAAVRDPRHVEEIVEQPGHVLRLTVDDLCRLATASVERRLQFEHARRAQDRRQRIAQLVRQHRQEVLAPLRRFLQVSFGLAPFRDVEERDDGADHLVVLDDRVAPVLRRERRAVGAPQHLVVDVEAFAMAHRLEYGRVLRRVRRPVGLRVVDERMNRFADQIRGRS
jgi:hypothetical protein